MADRCCQGEYQILRADLVYDSGVALNPALDIGQLEGVSSPALFVSFSAACSERRCAAQCYVMGAGMCLTEQQVHSQVDGRLVGAGTWEYKPPSALDIPLQFNIWFTQTPNKAAGNVLGTPPQ